MIASQLLTLALSIVEFTATYNGGQGNYQIRGFRPSGSGSYPLFIYTTGTTMNYWGNDGQVYTRWMAENGVVGASVNYAVGGFPLACSGFQNKAESIFSGTRAASALRTLCDLPYVNCDAGIVVSGMSQGAQIASLSQNYATPMQISGVFEVGGGYSLGAGNGYACLRYVNLALDNSRIRSGVGERDNYFGGNMNGVRSQQQIITGLNCTGVSCWQSGGSGWQIITAGQTASNGHCYNYVRGSCSQALDQTWLNSNAEWGFAANFNWLLSKVQRQGVKPAVHLLKEDGNQ